MKKKTIPLTPISLISENKELGTLPKFVDLALASLFFLLQTI